MNSHQVDSFAMAAMGFGVGVISALIAVLIARLTERDSIESRLSALEAGGDDDLDDEPETAEIPHSPEPTGCCGGGCQSPNPTQIAGSHVTTRRRLHPKQPAC